MKFKIMFKCCNPVTESLVKYKCHLTIWQCLIIIIITKIILQFEYFFPFSEGLKEYFSKYGDIAEVMVMKDPTTRRSR